VQAKPCNEHIFGLDSLPLRLISDKYIVSGDVGGRAEDLGFPCGSRLPAIEV
jgi:hypothetical protein